MSKIVILLVVVLVASAVDAVHRSDHPESLKKRLESYFVTQINEIEEKYNTIKSIVKEKSGLLYNINGNPIYAKASDDVYAMKIKAEAEVRELIIKTQNTGASKDCDKMTKICKITTDFLAQVYDCIAQELSVARERISVMDSEYEDLHSSLIDRRSRIAACHSIIDNTGEVDTAISCLEALEKETKSFITKDVPSVVANINDTNNYLSGRLESRLAKCSNGYVALRMEAAHLTGRAKICYQQKIDEAAVRLAQ